jgi:hypothetical protein
MACRTPWLGALWVLLVVVFAEATMEHEPADHVQQLGPEGDLMFVETAEETGRRGGGKGKPAGAKSVSSAKEAVMKSTKRLNAAKAAVKTAATSMKTAHITKALSATEMAAIKKRILSKSKSGKASKAKLAAKAKQMKERKSKAKGKAMAKAMKKIVRKQMKKQEKKVAKAANKAAKKAGKALVKKAAAKKKAKDNQVQAAQKIYDSAKKAHDAAKMKFTKTKAKAKKAGINFKAEEKAAKAVNKAVKAAKRKPVADDDKPPKPKLSALQLAKIAAKDRKSAYDDHMASARAADKEAAADRALRNADNQVSSLKQEVDRDKVAAKAQEGVSAAARFNKDQAAAKQKFSPAGNTTRLAEKQVVEKDQRTLNKAKAKVKKTLKDEKMSAKALKAAEGQVSGEPEEECKGGSF